MTHQPDIARCAHRRAIAVLLGAVALPSTALAQETVTPPPVLVPSQQAPAPAPAPAPAQAGESRTRIAPGVIEQAEQEARERAAAQRAERAAAQPSRPARPTRAVERPEAPVRATAPAPRATPQPAAPEPSAPVAATSEITPPAEVAPAPTQPAATTTETTTTEPAPVDGGSSMWLILAALGLAAAAAAAFLLLRRRPRDEELTYDDYVQPEPVAPVRERAEPVIRPEPVHEGPVAPRAADPVAAAPLFVTKPEAAPLNDVAREPAEAARPVRQADEVQPALENAELVTPDSDDIDAVLGGARQRGGRPQLELAMRPTQAGISSRGATVAFELTVANAGDTPAEDVRIGAFMLGDNAAASSEIERLLTNPPADHVVPAERIEPGDGKRLNASVLLPRELVDAVAGEGHDFTPVLVADARYRLPDGSEGRTAAAFTIGRVNGGEQLVPIALQDDPAMYADIEARLHSVPAKI